MLYKTKQAISLTEKEIAIFSENQLSYQNLKQVGQEVRRLVSLSIYNVFPKQRFKEKLI